MFWFYPKRNSSTKNQNMGAYATKISKNRGYGGKTKKNNFWSFPGIVSGIKRHQNSCDKGGKKLRKSSEDDPKTPNQGLTASG